MKGKRVIPMKRYDSETNDLLKNYLDKSLSEKAPEGFSPKMMSLIFLESKAIKKEKNYKIPVISCVLILILISISVALPESAAFTSLFSSIDIRLPELRPVFRLPDICLHVFSGILLLVIFDLMLNSMFRHQKKR